MENNYYLSYACISDKGLIRHNNEDNYCCDGQIRRVDDTDKKSINGIVHNDAKHVFGIFDGLGGEESGEVASYIAAESANLLMETDDIAGWCRKTNQDICDYMADNDILSMGTTLALLLFDQSVIRLCNIGDSRIYCFHDNALKQLSYDHVMPTSFGKKPLLAQNLGIPASELNLEPFESKLRYHDEDVYVICSDGLTDMLSDQDIETTVREENRPEDIVEKLVDKALSKGGKDNITTIAIKLEKEKISLFERLFRTRGK